MSHSSVARLKGLSVITAIALSSPVFAAPVKPAPDLLMVKEVRPIEFAQAQPVGERLFIARSSQPSTDEAPPEWRARYVRPCTKSGKRLVC